MIKTAFGSYIRGPVNIGGGKGTTIFYLADRMVELSRSVSKIDVVEEREQDDPLWALSRAIRARHRRRKGLAGATV